MIIILSSFCPRNSRDITKKSTVSSLPCDRKVFNLITKFCFNNSWILRLVEDVMLETNSVKNSSVLTEAWEIMRVVWSYALSVALIFMVTLALFPATTSNVQSINKADGSPWTGRAYKWGNKSSWYWLMVEVFIPTCLLCVEQIVLSHRSALFWPGLEFDL